MKTANMIVAVIFALGVLVLYLPAIGSTSDLLPDTRTQGDVTYVTGGVGQEESSAMRRAAGAYALEIVCLQKAAPGSEFLADVKVQVLDSLGKVVLDVTTDGPYLLANLPQGGYTITAESQGNFKQQKVRLERGKHRKTVFIWDRPAT